MSDSLASTQSFINKYATITSDTNLNTNLNINQDDNYEDEKDESIGVNNPFPKNAFEVGKDLDGSIKYSFDTIYQDKNLINVARDYFAERDGHNQMSDKDVIDEFVNDRTWKQANTLFMAGELKYVLDDDTSVEQKQRISYLMNYWNQLPNFYAEGGRGWWKGLSSNIIKGMADPLNYVGGFLGGQVVKQGVKTAGKEVLNKAVQKEILTKAVVKGTGITMAADATLFGGADAIMQSTEMELGMRKEYNPMQTGYAVVVGAGTTLLPSIASNYFVGKKSLKTQAIKEGIDLDLEIQNKTSDPSLNKIINKTSAKKIKENPLSTTEESKSLMSRYERTKGAVFDMYNPIKFFQEKIDNVAGSVEGLKKGIKDAAIKFDPVALPYFMFRMLAGSTTRADAFLKSGYRIARDLTSKEFGYDKTGNKGILEVLKPFNQAGHMETLLNYVGALRSNGIRANAVGKTVGKQRNSYLKSAPFTKTEADRIINYVELTELQYKKKYKLKDAIAKPELDFVKGANEIKAFMDDGLKYSLSGQVIDEKQLKNIQKAHKWYLPFYSTAKTKIDNKQSLYSDFISRTVTGVGSPIKKTLKGVDETVELKPFLESILDHTYSNVVAADKNLAKVSLYNMLERGVKNGTIAKNQVVREITGQKNIERVKNAVTNVTIKKLRDMGAKIDDAGLDQLDSSFTTMAFADTLLDNAEAANVAAGKKIDIFYDKGKFRAFVIEDEGLAAMYQNFDARTDAILSAVSRFTMPFARIPSNAITHSPPFIAFNFVRDTLSGAVNSAFGFAPFATTIKGGLKTMKGVGDPTNVTAYKEMFEKADRYSDSLVAGMGYSTRKETERFIKKTHLDVGTSPATGYYKKALQFFHTHYAGLKPAAQGYQEFVSRVEYATRLGEFELAKKAGFSDVAAAFAGREIATDFAMKGNNKILNAYSRNTMFFNAGLQGFYRGMRRAKENPRKFVGMVGATVVAPSLALWSLNNERREYEEVPDEIKQLNYLIPIFEDEKEDGSHKWPNGQRRVKFFFPIPKPYDFGVFGNTAVAIAEGFQEKSPMMGLSLFFKSLNQIMPGTGFYRGGKGGITAGPVSLPFVDEPAFLRPWSDLINNHDWVGSKITPYGMEKLEPNLRIKTNTRESVIHMANFFNAYMGGSLEDSIVMSAGGGIVGAGLGYLKGGAGGALVGLLAGSAGGATISKLNNPIEMDYIINSYMTGLLSYPLN